MHVFIHIHFSVCTPLSPGVNLEALRCTNYLPGGLELSQTDKSHEMLCMCRERETVYAGLRRGAVQAFNTRERRFTVECDVTAGAGTLVGVAKHDRCGTVNFNVSLVCLFFVFVCFHSRILVTCTDTGSLATWRGKGPLSLSLSFTTGPLYNATHTSFGSLFVIHTVGG